MPVKTLPGQAHDLVTGAVFGQSDRPAEAAVVVSADALRGIGDGGGALHLRPGVGRELGGPQHGGDA